MKVKFLGQFINTEDIESIGPIFKKNAIINPVKPIDSFIIKFKDNIFRVITENDVNSSCEADPAERMSKLRDMLIRAWKPTILILE